MRAPSFWYPANHRPNWQALLLAPLGRLYDFIGRMQRALASPFDPGVPVICAGNLTAGGTGKTPIVIAILKRLRARGIAAFALTRGYGGAGGAPFAVAANDGAARAGDEALLLARHAPVIVAADRRAGAALAVSMGATVIVMDDGFQNPSLKKTLSLVVVDSDAGFGNGLCIPAGPLRERVEDGLARADAVIVAGDGNAFSTDRAMPVLRAHLEPDAASAEALTGRAVFAFAGIGRPEKFFISLERLGARIAGRRVFPDHHAYTAAEIGALRAEAAALGAALVTTEKDLVRLDAATRAGIETLPVAIAFSDEAALDRLLAHAVPAYGSAA